MNPNPNKPNYVRLPIYECTRCNFAWVSKAIQNDQGKWVAAAPPIQCPNQECRSPRWNRPRIRFQKPRTKAVELIEEFQL